MARRPNNRRKNSKKKPQLEKQVRAEPVEVRRFFISSTSIDTVAGSITVVSGGITGIAQQSGHPNLAFWLFILTIWLAVFTLIAHSYEKNWAPWLIRGRPWRLSIICAALIGAVAAIVSQSLPTESNANRARTDILTYDKRAILKERLKKLPSKSVWLLRMDQSPESREFCDVMEALLVETGRFAGFVTAHEVSMNLNSPGRVVVQRINQSPQFETVSKALAAALTDAGIPEVTIDPSFPAIGGAGGIVQLLIKPK